MNIKKKTLQNPRKCANKSLVEVADGNFNLLAFPELESDVHPPAGMAELTFILIILTHVGGMLNFTLQKFETWSLCIHRTAISTTQATIVRP